VGTLHGRWHLVLRLGWLSALEPDAICNNPTQNVKRHQNEHTTTF
jgi:hypothetical protein